MCIIAWVPPNNSYYTKEVAKECAISNRDGIGFAFAYKGNITILKGFRTVDAYWEAFEPISKNFTTISHFRLATHGDKSSDENCHPFLINKQLCMAHNGIISIPMDKGETRSDTSVFVDEILKKLPPNFLQDRHLCDMISSYIGTGSKLCFLTGEGRTYWIHKNQGVEHGGCWFSNSGFKKYTYTYYNNTNVYKGSNYRNKEENTEKKSSTGTIDNKQLKIPGTSGVLNDIIIPAISAVKGAVMEKEYIDLVRPKKEDSKERQGEKEEGIKEPTYYNYFCTKCEEDIINSIGDIGPIECPTCKEVVFQGEITEQEYQESLLDDDTPSLCDICEIYMYCQRGKSLVKYCDCFVEEYKPDQFDEPVNCNQCTFRNICNVTLKNEITTYCESFIYDEKIEAFCPACRTIITGWDTYSECDTCGSELREVYGD